MTKLPTPAEIAEARTLNGGWSREQLAQWGVPWPPPKGWRKQLESGTPLPRPILPDQKVYAVRAAGGYVKIGTTKDLGKRMEALQCGQPSTLELVAVGPGGRDLEQRLHLKYKHRRVRGEWFMLSDGEILELRAFLGGSVTTMYLPKVRHGRRTKPRQAFKGGSFRLS